MAIKSNFNELIENAIRIQNDYNEHLTNDGNLNSYGGTLTNDGESETLMEMLGLNKRSNHNHIMIKEILNSKSVNACFNKKKGVTDLNRALNNVGCMFDDLSHEFNNIKIFKEKEKTITLVKAWFNEDKGVTVVKWSDDTITKVTLQNNDEWDGEKSIALCYMKKMCGNNSSFNEVLKEQVYNSED